MTRDGRRREAERAVRKAAANRDRARRKLLQQRRKLARRRERNRERVAENRAENEGSNNPTVHSTVPPTDTNEEAAARNSTSTVPERPQGSETTPRRRLYGLRLHRVAEGSRRTDDDE